jgi:serine protease Do
MFSPNLFRKFFLIFLLFFNVSGYCQENNISLSPKNIIQKNNSSNLENSKNTENLSSSKNSLSDKNSADKNSGDKNPSNKNPSNKNSADKNSANKNSLEKNSNDKTSFEKNSKIENNSSSNSSSKTTNNTLEKTSAKSNSANKNDSVNNPTKSSSNPSSSNENGILANKNSSPKIAEKNSDNSLKNSTNNSEKTAKNLAKSNLKNSDNFLSRQAISNSFADLVEDLLPSVVNITTTQELRNSNSLEDNLIEDFPKTPLFDDLRKHLERQLRGSNEVKKKLSSIGSGFLISKDGIIVTNHHVIDDASDITVSLFDGTKYKAKIIGIDKKTDIALLKINPTKELKFATFGDSQEARIGEWVIVIGNPYGLGGSVSLGIVSARGRDINNTQSDEFIQTDAAINKGNSGGPMFNVRGEVIGVSTAIFSPSGGNVGIGFATPSNNVIQIVKQLRDQGEVTRGWIGVSVQDISQEIADSMKLENNKGAFVVEVIKDSPADKAGVLPTDIIIKFEDQEIEDMKFLPKAVAKFPVGKIAKLQILRQGKIKTLKITIEKLKDNEVKKIESKPIDKKPNIKPTAQILGLSLAEFKSKIRKDKNEINIEGLLVIEVNSKSESAEKGIQIGDIILSANQTPLKSVDDLKEIIEENSKSNKKIFLFIRRGEISYPAVLNLK